MTVKLPSSKVILAIDPGETTGFVIARWTRLAGPYPAMLYWGQWKGMDDLLANIHLFDDADICVVEDYIVYPGKAQSHATSRLYTAREIGVLSGYALWARCPSPFRTHPEPSRPGPTNA